MNRNDEAWLKRALVLARRNLRRPEGGPFGALLVRDGVVLGEGWNRVLATHDPTAHAEVVAIRRATRRLGTPHLAGATLYTSCEPCPMCLSSAYWAQVERVVYAANRDDAAGAGFSDALIYEELAVPVAKRRMRLEQSMAAEGAGLFREWLAMPGHQLY